MGNCLGALVIAWTTCNPLAASADARALDLVQQMQVALKSLDYEGIFVYQHADNLDTLRVIHRGSGGAESERIITLSGPRREIIREGSRVTVKLAADHAVLVEEHQPRESLGRGFTGYGQEFDARYRFQLENIDRVAGRSAQIVQITPQTADRYSYRLWIDQASGLPLKSMIVDLDGQPLEQEQFATVTVGVPPSDEDFKSELLGSDFVWYVRGETPVPQHAAGRRDNWRVAWLPAGFVQHRDLTRHLAASRLPVRQFVYSDGLATVSVFIEKLGGDASPLVGDSNLGAVNVFSRLIDHHQVTVVGEMPRTMVRQIAASVAPQTLE